MCHFMVCNVVIALFFPQKPCHKTQDYFYVCLDCVEGILQHSSQHTRFRLK